MIQWRCCVGGYTTGRRKCLETTLVSFVETLAHSLKLPYIAIWSEMSGISGEPLAVYGTATTDSVNLPLSYQGEKVGAVGWAGLRSKGRQRSPSHEQQLLATVCPATRAQPFCLAAHG
ncbi:MAG: hypothetical protein IPL78_35760 [Chloroflexi bacterium]|nr:hypothetical protein [Chloroflexota bacterium]